MTDQPAANPLPSQPQELLNEGLRHRAQVSFAEQSATSPTSTTTTTSEAASPSTPAAIPTSPQSASPASASTAKSLDDDANDEPEFMCNICLETASNPIVTLCGHLYCWNCIFYWMTGNSPFRRACPVCKALVEKDKLVPIYGRGRKTDPRLQPVPERPRAEAPPQVVRQGGWDAFRFAGPRANVGGNGAVVVGFGLFPSLFGIQMTVGGMGGTRQAMNPAQQQAFVSRAFMMVWGYLPD
ncbi:hypothetical protein HDU87_002860 [Geranomyces variabilis]|uniref:RING-type E3 ubiquitin transferase n=1 Tax=Geranomyces variabilis TaxID=109894 RepID=A0AAD5TL52_9FUNG|nr:hypothetical protein HDU87_002860 [Geranomyces variabilis]